MFRISRIDSFINDSLSACCVSSGCGNKIAERAPHQQVALSDRGRQKGGGWVGWSGGGGEGVERVVVVVVVWWWWGVAKG